MFEKVWKSQPAFESQELSLSWIWGEEIALLAFPGSKADR